MRNLLKKKGSILSFIISFFLGFFLGVIGVHLVDIISRQGNFSF